MAEIPVRQSSSVKLEEGPKLAVFVKKMTEDYNDSLAEILSGSWAVQYVRQAAPLHDTILPLRFRPLVRPLLIKYKADTEVQVR